MKKKHKRTAGVAIATGIGLAVMGLLLRGLAPELVRYFRIRRM